MNVNQKTDVKRLQGEVARIMKRIRATTPRVIVSPDQAKASEVWEACYEEQPIERVIIYLRSSGCFWAIKTQAGKTEFRAGCLDCEHSVAATTFGMPISAESYIKQFKDEYEKFDFSKYPMLCLYNEGNFFNEAELPKEARHEILRTIASNPHIKVVILECLPEFITEDVLEETKTLLGDKHVEIGMGLESANPLIRAICVNKSFTLEKFVRTVELMNRYFHSLAYVLIKPSFLTESEALEDAIKSVKYAFEVGVQIVSLEPINIGEYAMSGALNRIGYYRPAWLWTVLEVTRAVCDLGEVRIGGYQFAPTYKRFAHNCDLCTMRVKEAIRQYNATYNLECLKELDCSCKATWRDEIQKEYPPLLERVSETLIHLRKFYPEPTDGAASLINIEHKRVV